MIYSVKEKLAEFIFNIKYAEYLRTNGDKIKLVPRISAFLSAHTLTIYFDKESQQIILNAANRINEDNQLLCEQIDFVYKKMLNDDNLYCIYEKDSEQFSSFDSIEETYYKHFLDIIKNKRKLINHNKKLSIYTKDRIDNYSIAVKAISILKKQPKISDKELCKKLGVLYYTEEECWPLLKDCLINRGCDDDDLERFKSEWNAVYCWEEIHNNPNVTLDELKKGSEI